MAEEEKNEAQAGAEAAEREVKKFGPGKLIAIGAITVGLGAAAAFMAVPGKQQLKRFKGAFHHALVEEKFSTNLRDANQTRFLQIELHSIYYAYEKEYLLARVADPMYKPMLLTAVGRVISSKFIADSAEGPAREAFLEEMCAELDPIVFPVHIGQTAFPLDRDEQTGLRPGRSFSAATFRGRFHDHYLHIDALAGTLQLDDGEVVTFETGDENVKVSDVRGDTLYIDVSDINVDFQGHTQVGIYGRLGNIMAPEFIVQ
jgi:hypothetical protein